MNKIIKAWAGIVDDKLDLGWLESKSFKDGLYGIFKTKKEAKSHYKEVVPCEIKLKLKK